MAPPSRTSSFRNPIKSDSSNVSGKKVGKKNVKRESSFRNIKHNVPPTVPVKSHGLITPYADTAFKALLSARFCAAIWSHITDCDETFNYWEPLHYLIFGKGLQTWEYSPEFALRSYTYLLAHGVPGWIYTSIFNPNPMLIFYFVRCLLALGCAVMEVYFYKAVCREFGHQVGRLWLLFQLFSPGMFIASTALLPSSFSMYFSMAAMAAWWHQKYRLAIFFTAKSALLGWPFAVVIGIPLCIDLLYCQRKYKTLFIWTIISGCTIGIPMLIIDSTYFGKFTFAPLNLIFYNVFTSHGPNLYGTEPLSYYLVNGFLNFNIIWILALIAPIMIVLCSVFIPAKANPTLYLPYYLSLAPFYLWLIVFFMQPHKEERFLFPVYPMICLCGAISIDIIQKIYFRLKNWIFATSEYGSHYLNDTLWIAAVAMIITATLGLSRIYALYNNYRAPFDIMMEINVIGRTNNIVNQYDDKQNVAEFVSTTTALRPDVTYNICFGKDWHRYPNSFFLPNGQFRIRFIESEFLGILPAYFTEQENGTSIWHPYFNDRNEGDDAMLFDLSKCHFLIDFDTEQYTDLEPNYADMQKEWTVIKTVPFLNAKHSHSIFRAFHIPFLSHKYIKFNNFNLLQRKRFKHTL